MYYACNANFALVGPVSRVCQGNGAWSNALPICTPSSPTGKVLGVLCLGTHPLFRCIRMGANTSMPLQLHGQVAVVLMCLLQGPRGCSSSSHVSIAGAWGGGGGGGGLQQ